MSVSFEKWINAYKTLDKSSYALFLEMNVCGIPGKKRKTKRRMISNLYFAGKRAGLSTFYTVQIISKIMIISERNVYRYIADIKTKS
jgi:predicted transcriptional regulator YheO